MPGCYLVSFRKRIFNLIRVYELQFIESEKGQEVLKAVGLVSPK